MTSPCRLLLTVFLALSSSLVACPAADGSSEGEGEGEGDGEDEASTCTAGCVATIAAACANGPASQAQCETDCEALRAGDCGAAYEVLLQCDGTVSCDAGGIPTVVGCEDEQAAFRACLNG